MLQILSASSLRSRLKGRRASLALGDLPRMVHDELGLNGLAFATDLLAGSSATDLEVLRRNADKAACPALLLYEPNPLPLTESRRGPEAMDRVQRVLHAAARLGCSSAGISLRAADNDRAFESIVEALKQVMDTADGLGLNMLIRPSKGLTATPERVTELIKRVGGFRIGTLPDFQTAAESEDPARHIRRLAPYAPVLLMATVEFSEEGRHTAYDLAPGVQSLVEVGYDATIAIDYRGAGDPAEGVAKTRDELARLFEEATT